MKSVLLTLCAVVLNIFILSDASCSCKKGFKCVLGTCVLDIQCPPAGKFGPGPPVNCTRATDPNKLPPSPLEEWFTEEIFEDLFPNANLGWGPNNCSPYSYQAFVIASRYFPKFGSESPDNGYGDEENHRRDLAAFFAHAIQETGENNADLYRGGNKKPLADACFYRGGFYNWFEGGPTSVFMPKENPGHTPEAGDRCISHGRYCIEAPEILHFFPCNTKKTGEFYHGCYFGRGAIQISFNFNYGQFNQWLAENNINVDVLEEPNAILTHRDPPLSILASLWFYMTPQPPKPAMHDIILGNWEPGPVNRKAGFEGPIFGPTSLIINNECNGEDKTSPGGPGESRRIKGSCTNLGRGDSLRPFD